MRHVHHHRHIAIMRATALVAICAVAGAIACSSDTNVPTNLDATLGQAPSGRTGGTDTSTTPTSNGPVASLTISPHQLTLPMGYYTRFVTTPRDAQGLYVVDKHATWRSSNPAVLVASDSGIFYAKALGTAKVYGTVDGQIDSASVTVIAAVAPGGDTAITPPPPPALPPVSAFNLTISVDGPLAGTDTTQTQHVAGTTVAVTRVMGVHGDTLNPSVPGGTITTDANGVGSLQNLPGGYYTLVATPPAGSPYVTSSFGIGAPTTSDVKVRIILLRRAP